MLEAYFEDFMYFFFPEVAEGVDWERGCKFLDNELRQVMKDAELGGRYADKLAQMWLKNGEEAWVLTHVEVQGWEDTDFPLRMFVYKDLEKGFWHEVSQLEEEKKMPYVTSVERMAREEGRRDGLIDAIEMGLSIKFGDSGLRFLPTIRSFEDIDRLVKVKEAIKATDNLSEIEVMLN